MIHRALAGKNREIAIFDQIKGFWRPIFKELDL